MATRVLVATTAAASAGMTQERPAEAEAVVAVALVAEAIRWDVKKRF